MAHPHEYALTYGSPVPGYAAPQDTVPSATRVGTALLSLVRDAHHAGRTPSAPTRPATEEEVASIAPVRSFVTDELDEAYAIRGLMAWATLFGNVSLELFGHMYRGILDYEAHYRTLVEQLADDLGL